MLMIDIVHLLVAVLYIEYTSRLFLLNVLSQVKSVCALQTLTYRTSFRNQMIHSFLEDSVLGAKALVMELVTTLNNFKGTVSTINFPTFSAVSCNLVSCMSQHISIFFGYFCSLISRNNQTKNQFFIHAARGFLFL